MILKPRLRFHQHLNPKLVHTLREDSPISHNIQLTSLLDSGNVNAARQLFDEMPQRTVVSWNAIISGYAKRGQVAESLALVSQMHRSCTRLNEVTFTSTLSACSRSALLDHGKQIHSLVLKSGFEDFPLVTGALLNIYSSCLDISSAYQLFDLLHCRNPLLWSLMVVGLVKSNLMDEALGLFEKMPATTRDVYSWTALISGYAQRDDDGECEIALKLFVSMGRSSEVKPNEFTYDSVLRVCTKLEALQFGKSIHGCLVRDGFNSDRAIGGAMIGFYCDAGSYVDAKKVFDQLEDPCSTTCNAMIESLVSMGKIIEAKLIFDRIEDKNPVSYNLIIKGYADNGRIEDSKALFDEMPCKNIVSYNILLSALHQAGEFDEALQLFERIEEKNTVTWNSMISGYVQNEQSVEAVKLYATMLRSSIQCSRSTFSALFRACANIGTVSQGRMLHAQLCKTPFESNVYVGTSLVDMYAKCGSVVDAKAAFSRIALPNVASWTTLINGLAHNGHGLEAILEFGRMSKHGVGPNAVTFVGLILACTQVGKVDEGMEFFNSMERDYSLVPTVEHYACIVDLLGRAGRVREAERFVDEMPIETDGVVWGALLSACWLCMDLEVGVRVAERVLHLDAKQVSAYVVMSNIYARVGRWAEVMEVRRRLRGVRVKKDPGCSWIEVKERVHVFCVEDRRHPETEEIYLVLDELRANVDSRLRFGPDPCFCQMDGFRIPSLYVH